MTNYNKKNKVITKYDHQMTLCMHLLVNLLYIYFVMCLL